MNASPYEPGSTAWMLSLPQWMRNFMARWWRHQAIARALEAERLLFNARLHRNEARRLEAAADWIGANGE